MPVQVKAGEILQSAEGKYYRVLEANDQSVSLMRVNGQTIFACRPEYVASAFAAATPNPASSKSGI